MSLFDEVKSRLQQENKSLAEYIQQMGVNYFIKIYNKFKDRAEDPFKWGDEVEFMLLWIDDEAKTVRVATRAQDLLQELQKSHGDEPFNALWHAEFGSFMLESTPGKPFESLDDLINVSENMGQRRREVEILLSRREVLVSMSNFPRLGCLPTFTYPSSSPDPTLSSTRSLFWPDQATMHQYECIVRNVRHRRGEKVAINIPVFPDRNSPREYLDDVAGADSGAKPGHIYMDAIGFGGGVCSLQITIQASHIKEAEFLFDQLAVLCPVFLALTASSSIFKGYLADTDCRWDVFSAATDCRTRRERQEGLVRPRHGSITNFISEQSNAFSLNDIKIAYDKEIYRKLCKNGISKNLAEHFAQILSREPLLYNSQRKEDGSVCFGDIEARNWQSVRLRLPHLDSSSGWRVEFRPCELQFTDFENAAIVCFIVLMAKVIINLNYNFLIPISKIDENMKRATKRDAILHEKFYFRTNILPNSGQQKKPIVDELTIDQIMNGDEKLSYPGLIPIVYDFLRNQDISMKAKAVMGKYFNLIRNRSTGSLKTNARFMRDFVLQHPEYQKDSRVSERITYDLIKKIIDIQKGLLEEPSLFGESIF